MLTWPNKWESLFTISSSVCTLYKSAHFPYFPHYEWPHKYASVYYLLFFTIPFLQNRTIEAHTLPSLYPWRNYVPSSSSSAWCKQTVYITRISTTRGRILRCLDYTVAEIVLNEGRRASRQATILHTVHMLYTLAVMPVQIWRFSRADCWTRLVKKLVYTWICSRVMQFVVARSIKAVPVGECVFFGKQSLPTRSCLNKIAFSKSLWSCKRTNLPKKPQSKPTSAHTSTILVYEV